MKRTMRRLALGLAVMGLSMAVPGQAAEKATSMAEAGSTVKAAEKGQEEAGAEVMAEGLRLPRVLGDHMVLQSDSEARLWGWGEKGSTVRITPSWSDQLVDAKVGRDGKWQATVTMPPASFEPLELGFSDGKSEIWLHDLLSGEVWVCAGQSNMEMTMNGFEACPVDGYQEAVIEAQTMPQIRFVKIPSVASLEPLDDADCRWQVLGAQTVGEASAVGYFFARAMTRALQVPVGLIMANKGGSRVESWLTRETLEAFDDVNLKALEGQDEFIYNDPLVWGNGTFNPILNYTVKGILFYQGCSNVGDPGDRYSERMALLVAQWREQFGLGELPFYYVETAPCTWKTVEGTERAYLREQQLKAADLIPHCGIVCTNDCVYSHEWRQIHPAKKQPVGERLALLALHYDYGMDRLMCESPRFDRMEISHDTCTVWLKNDYGAIGRYEDLEGFEMAGDDRVFYPARAVHWKRKGIILTCPEVPRPVAVRYCFRNFQVGNVANRAGLPLFPFRTDTW